MTRIEELEQNINLMSVVIKDAQEALNKYQKALAELKESKKEGKWKPAKGDAYWFRDSFGNNIGENWTDCNVDKWRCDNIPIFQTEETCKKYWHFMDTVKEKSYEFSKEEWGKEQPKYCIYYNYGNEHFAISDTFNFKYFGEIYFKTEAEAQYIIDNFKDELMEYWI